MAVIAPQPDDLLRIGPHTFRPRLMTGTGKYRNDEELNAALAASGCEVVTVALRPIGLHCRVNSVTLFS